MTFHETIIKKLLEYRENHPHFRFIPRQRNNNNRLENGYWFQGENYAFVGLIDRSGGINKTRSLGLVFTPKENNTFQVHLELVYKGETNSKLLAFYEKLKANIQDLKDVGSEKFIKDLGVTSDDFQAVYEFLNQFYPELQKMVLQEKDSSLIPNEDKFKRMLHTIENYRNQSSKKTNYWVFQGNPKFYDLIGALQNNVLTTWKVAAHKDKIKIGDKVILWLSGDKSGCYALAEVASDVGKVKMNENETKYYKTDYDDEEDRV